MANSRLDIEVTTNGTAGVVKRDLEAVGKAGATAGTTAAAGMKKVGAEATAAGYAVRSMNHTIAAIAVGAAIGKFAQLADEWQNIHNKLINVTGGTQNLNAVNEALFAGAQKARIEFGEFVNIYQELAIQAKRFGTSQQQMVDITTTMTQAAQLAHPSLAMMKMGVEQLILTMERGRMTTRAFSALLKDTPQLAKALADGLGIGINQLRELAHHSQLTSSQMIAALEKVGPKVAEEFARLTPTFHNSMVVLHNGWVKFIGDLDNSTGILGGLTSVIIGLSHHVDVLAFAVASFGTLAVAVFSGVAKRAIIAMWAALVASGPIGWAIAAIGTIAAALAIFGDRVAVTKDGMVSLLDYVKGAFVTLGDIFTAVAGFLTGVWAAIEPSVKPVIDWIVSSWMYLEGLSGTIFKAIVNFIIGTFVFGYKAIVNTFSELPDALYSIFTSVFDWLSKKFGGLINGMIDGINAVSNFAGLGSIGHVTPQSYGGDGFAAAKKYASDMGKAAGEAYGTDYVGAAGAAVNAGASWVNGKIMKHAREFSAARRNQTGIGDVGTDHGDAEDDPLTGKKKHASHAKTRGELMIEELAKFHDQTVDANDLSLTPWNDAAAKEVTRFNDQLKKTKDAKGHFMSGLTPEEETALRRTVQAYEDANRVQKERFALLDEFQGPQVKYQDTLKAISQLESTHAITAEQAARAERDAAISLLDTRFDAASGKMKGTLEILKEMDDKAHPLAEAMKGIWSEQEGPLRTFQTQMEAVNALLEQQLITAREAAKASRDAAISYLDTQTDAASGVTRALLKIQRTAEDSATRMEQTITDAFQGMEDAWVALMTGDKFDPKALIKTIQTDLAKDSFQKMVGPIAGFLQSKFGIALPGLMGKVGESRANPMWVRSADSILPGQDVVGGAGGDSAGIQSILGFLGIGGSGSGGVSGPLGGDTQVWDESFDRFNQNIDGTLVKNANNFGSVLGGVVALLGSQLGGLLGAKKGGFLDTLLNIGVTVGSAYLGSLGGGGGANAADLSGNTGMSSTLGFLGYATGGDFTVGGKGGVDSQLVQFKASPGERVSVGDGALSGGDTINYYSVEVDARGTDAAQVEANVTRAITRAFPAMEKKTRAGAVQDVFNRGRRQTLPGGRQ